MDPFIGEIVMFGGNFAPRGWALCDGQLLAISQNTALFSILGTTYGGDGRTTFALPDLRGRAPMHAGNGPGLTDRKLGAKVGNEQTTLNITNMPSHSHSMTASTSGPAQGDPSGGSLPTNGRGEPNIYAAGAGTVAMGSSTTPAGGNLPFSNIQPSLCVNYIIATVGVFPSRS